MHYDNVINMVKPGFRFIVTSTTKDIINSDVHHEYISRNLLRK